MTIWGGGTFTCTVDRSSGSSAARVPNHDLKKSSTKSGRQRSFLLLELPTSSNHSRSSLSSCCCSLPVPSNVFKHLYANISHSKPLSQLQHRCVPVLRLRIRSLCSFKAASLPNFNKMVRCELLIMGVQQLEDVFSILRTNFRAWINTSDIEEKDVKLDDFYVGGLL